MAMENSLSMEVYMMGKSSINGGLSIGVFDHWRVKAVFNSGLRKNVTIR
jgi:hypothetical protein